MKLTNPSIIEKLVTPHQEKLQDLLRELFQFDSADLDFGFYAVINQKRDVINKFIMHDLPLLISEGLEAVATQNREELKAALTRAREKVIETLSADAFDGDLLKDYPATTLVGKAYLAAKEKLDKVFVPEDVEVQIYNDLYAFFARYYQDGDFISQRRYGASDKYAVPYNGEEVYLHWVNSDQYYVKTGVHFQNYSFVVPGDVSNRDTNVQVRLTKVDVPRDNVKGKKRFFVYSTDFPVEWDERGKTLIIPMEYRPLRPEESKLTGNRNQQEILLEAAYVAILAAIPNKVLKARLMEIDPHKKTEKDRLMYHLNRYAAENTRDFFVHKDLGGFLRREFDYYLKAEILRLEDIDFSDTIFAERKAAQLKTTRQIGEAIIRFLDQLEQFQKQLFLKRKFVLQSDYCLTLDKIPVTRREDFYPAILGNEQQLAEWEKLYGVIVTAETNLNFHPHLMLDTALFDINFKWRLLACFNNIDDSTDGLLIHGENFQALSMLMNRYTTRVKCIHIDPPYNTASSGFLYKNSFQHSSWLSMMRQTHELAVQLLGDDGVLQCHIDEYEQERLHLLFEAHNTENAGTMIWNKGTPVTGAHGLATQHEYILWRSKGNISIRSEKENVQNIVAKAKALVKKYGLATDEALKEYRSWLRESKTLSNSEKTYNTFDDAGQVFRSDNMSATDKRRNEKFYKPLIHPITNQPCPVPANGWRYTPESMAKLLKENVILFGDDHTTTPRRKSFLEDNTSSQMSTIYFSGGRGKFELDKLGVEFPFAHPTELYSHLIGSVTEENDIVMDFFAGSGTTGHAVINLRRDFEERRKYVLVEMGSHFNTVLKPRIQKVVYSSEWKDGKPVEFENGQPHMFQYLCLESYDDTFYNIRFREDAGPQMKLFNNMDYLLGYMLDHETAGSPTLLDIEQFKRPFDYKLLVTGEDGVLHKQPVDLATTFNFLLGLAVQTIRWYEDSGHPYVRVMGTSPEGSQICVLWRNSREVDELDAEQEWLLTNVLHDVTYDKLYVNGENVIPDALLIEDAFKRRMFDGVA